MVYAQPEDLQNPALGVPTAALERLVDPESADPEADLAAILTEAIASGSGVADGYLARVYTLPLTAYGRDLTRAVCAIAVYDLMCGGGYQPDGGPDEQIRLRYEDAIKWLTAVSKGTVQPVGVVDSEVATDAPSIQAPVVFTNARRGW